MRARTRAAFPSAEAIFAAAFITAFVWPCPPVAGAAPVSVRLSNEFTLSRWAYPTYASKVRTAPRTTAHTFTRLRYRTEDGQPELYIALRSAIRKRGLEWVQVRIPGRPNGRKGWIKRTALGPFHVVRKALVVNRKTLRATLYFRGNRIWHAPVGVGRPSSPTPAGRFYVREKLRSLDPFYGPVALGTSAYGTATDWPGHGVVGLHGTSMPWLVPGRPSHGCIRIKNRQVVRLDRLTPLGTPVRIK